MFIIYSLCFSTIMTKKNAKYLRCQWQNWPLVVNDPFKLLFPRYNVFKDGKAAVESRIRTLILVRLKSRSCRLLKMFESIQQNKMCQKYWCWYHIKEVFDFNPYTTYHTFCCHEVIDLVVIQVKILQVAKCFKFCIKKKNYIKKKSWKKGTSIA